MDNLNPGSSMRQSELEKKLRNQEIPWNDIRERTVLARVMQSETAPRWKKPLTLAIASSIAIVIATFLFMGLRNGETKIQATETARRLDSPEGESILTFAELGRAVLYDGAEVNVTQQDDTIFLLSQTSGAVRYDINPSTGRETMINAAGVIVRVVGTLFYIEVEGEMVRVVVERGIVQVDDSRQVMELAAGEEVTVIGDHGRQHLFGNSNPQKPLESYNDGGVETTAYIRDNQNKARLQAKAESKEKRDDVQQSLDIIDTVRREGRLSEAASLLRKLVRKHPDDPRSIAGLFTLGNVERSLGNFERSAEAFQRCWRRMPRGSLAEDARAEEAVSWHKTGRTDKAVEAAAEYLKYYPRGIHRTRMERLVQ